MTQTNKLVFLESGQISLHARVCAREKVKRRTKFPLQQINSLSY